MESYAKAAELADVHLGPDHEIARTLNTSRDAAVKVAPHACPHTSCTAGCGAGGLTAAARAQQLSNKAASSAASSFGPRIGDDYAPLSRPVRRPPHPRVPHTAPHTAGTHDPTCWHARPQQGERRQVGSEVGPTSAFCSCIPTGMHGPTCIFWADLASLSLTCPPLRAGLARGRLQPAVDIPRADRRSAAVPRAERLPGDAAGEPGRRCHSTLAVAWHCLALAGIPQ
jgi:hypothetical protein